MRKFLPLILAVASWAQAPGPSSPSAPEVIVLNDAALGAVTFQHKLHEERAGGRCEACHHASRPERPESRPWQACRDCHTKQPETGMKTSRQAAFHNPSAQSGTCADCHRTQIAAGKKPPQKCFDCHKRQARTVAAGLTPHVLP